MNISYESTMELLQDGIITHTSEDIFTYQKEESHFLLDRRTTRIAEDTFEVYPLGKAVGGYWFYVCPDCGEVHSIHKNNIHRGKPIYCGCKISKKAKSRLSIYGAKIPAKKVLLMIY